MGLMKSLDRLPNLEKIQVTHTGTARYRLRYLIDPLHLDYQMNWFSFLKGIRRIVPLGGSPDGPYYRTVAEFFKEMWRLGIREHPRTDFQIEFHIWRPQESRPSITDSWE